MKQSDVFKISSKTKLSPTWYLCVLSLHVILLVGEVHLSHGHLAAFVNAGKYKLFIRYLISLAVHLVTLYRVKEVESVISIKM